MRTRLLYWTTAPLIALYFATAGEQAGDRTTSATVFTMDPEPGTGLADFPIRVAQAHIDPRVIAESSVFTLHGVLLASLDSYFPIRPHIANLEIAGGSVASISEELAYLGYDRARVFPELARIAERVLHAGQQAFDRWEPSDSEP